MPLLSRIESVSLNRVKGSSSGNKTAVSAESKASPWIKSEISSLNELQPYTSNASSYGIARFNPPASSEGPAWFNKSPSRPTGSSSGYRGFYTHPDFCRLEAIAREMESGASQNIIPRKLNDKESELKQPMDARIMESIDDIFYSVKGAKHTKKAARAWREKIAEILKDVEKSKKLGRPFPPTNCARIMSLWGKEIQSELVDDIKEERFFRM